MGLLDLFVAALMPVLKVLLITAVGSFLALDRVDVLGAEARKHLNDIAFFVFNPSLVCSNLAKYITLKSMIMLWFMPLNILVTFIIGSALGWLLIRAIRTPKNLQGLVLGCCAAGNLGNMPIIIIPAICKEKGSPFGDADACLVHGLAYASLSMAIGSLCIWSYVYNIVRIYSSKDSEEDKLNTLAKDTQSGGESPENLSKCSPGALLPIQGCSPNEGSMDHFELERTEPENKMKEPHLESIKQCLQMVGRKLDLKKLLSPSTIGVIIGFIVGSIAVFRNALIGDTAPLRVVQDSAYMLGEAAIPTVTLTIGANLLNGLKWSDVQLSAIIGIIVVRYILLPIFGAIIVKSAIHFGLVPSNPLYQFVLLLQFALPPSVSIGTMTQLFGAGESQFSLIMLATYALAAVTLTLWSTFFMWLVK